MSIIKPLKRREDFPHLYKDYKFTDYRHFIFSVKGPVFPVISLETLTRVRSTTKLLHKFHVIYDQNTRVQITRGRRSKRA